ncbi:MAG: DUF6531 domain-containing protein, partial [Clostridium sp.]|nr:DUF6531 domain-containing protein [Clostridium sp.]
MGKRLLAVIMAAVMVLQGIQIDNYRYMSEAYAAGVDSTKEKDIQSGAESAVGIVEPEGQEQTGSSQEESDKGTDEKKETLLEESDRNQEEAEKPEPYSEEQAQESTSEEIIEKPDIPEQAAALVGENGKIEGDYSIGGISVLTEDLVVTGDLKIGSPLFLNGHTLTVQGNVNQFSALSVDGTLTVEGNYNWNSGDITFYGGSLQIEKTLDISAMVSSSLIMHHKSDYLFVGGDISIYYRSTAETDIDNGILELQGNFLQMMQFTEYFCNETSSDFVMSGESCLLLSGTGLQNIYIRSEDTWFEHVEVKTEGREKEEGGYDFGQQQVAFGLYCNFGDYEDYGCPTSYGYVPIEAGTLSENTTIYGNGYLAEGELALNGYTLDVQGDLIQNGDIRISRGTLNIYGDYRVQSLVQKGIEKTYAATTARIDSQNGGTVRIYEDFITESVTDHTGYLTSGAWYFNGDIIQKGETAKNFVTGGNWTANMWRCSYKCEKQEKRHITLDNPIENPIRRLYAYSYYSTVIVDHGIYLLQPASSQLTLEGHSFINQDNIACLQSSYCDVEIIGPVDLGTESYYTYSDVTVRADCTLNGGFLSCKNMTVLHGTVHVEAGRIFVEGNLEFPDGSDGTLSMTGEERSSIACNNFYMGSKAPSGEISSGELSITGNMTQRNNGTAGNLVTTGEAVVTFNGSNVLQRVNIESREVVLENVVIANYGSGRVFFETEVTIHNLDNRSNSLVKDGMEGYTLIGNTTYAKNVTLYGGVLDLNGYTLTIDGNFTVAMGTVVLNGGRLIVKGDMRLQDVKETQEGSEYSSSNGTLVMYKEADIMEIDGDWYIQAEEANCRNMTKGTVYLAGDLQYITQVTHGSRNETLIGGAKLCLNGEKEQVLQQVTEGVKQRSYLLLGGLDIRNPAKVSMDMGCLLEGDLCAVEGADLTFENLNVSNLSYIRVPELSGDVTVFGASRLNGDLKIHGNLYVLSPIELGGQHLEAEEIRVSYGNHASIGSIYVKEYGSIKVDTGSLKADTLSLYGMLEMTEPEGKVEVGEFQVNIQCEDAGAMTDGTIRVTGDYQDQSAAGYGILPTGNHRIIFEKKNGSEDNLTNIMFHNSDSIFNIAELAYDIHWYTSDRYMRDIAKTLVCENEDGEPPTVPQRLTCKSSGYYYVSLGWEESTDNTELKEYRIYRNGEYIGQSRSNYYVDRSLPCGEVYTYCVTAVDTYKNESAYSKEITAGTKADKKAPVRRTDPTIHADSGKVTIDLSNTFQDGESYVDYYIVTRNGEEAARILEKVTIQYPNANGDLISSCIRSGTAVFKDEGLTNGTAYQYTITAVDAAGNTSEAVPVSVTPYPLPEAPADFKAEAGEGYVHLSFLMSGTADCECYSIYRKEDSEKTFRWMQDVPNTEKKVMDVLDRDIQPGYQYSYYVKAENQYGDEGGKTSQKTVKAVADLTPPEITSVQYSIDGDKINEPLQFYVTASDKGYVKDIQAYYRKLDEKQEFPVKGEILKGQDTEKYRMFVLDTEELEGEYVIRITAVDYTGNEAEETKTIKVNIEGLQPVQGIKTSATDSTVSIQWEPVEGAKKYVVERYHDGKYVAYEAVTGTSVHIENLVNNTEYQFRIAAYDQEGCRGLSTKPFTVETESDMEPPVIRQVYDNQKVLTMEDTLSVVYYDNIGVATVGATYRKTGALEWELAGAVKGTGRQGTAIIKWDKSHLTSGTYEVKYQITDVNGNESEEIIRVYNLKLDAPVINNLVITPSDWKIQIQWDAFTENNFKEWRLTRTGSSGQERQIACGVNETSFEEIISPEEEYRYTLYAYNTLGNVSKKSVSAKPGDKDVFAPEVPEIGALFAAQNTPLALSADGCTDNDGIVSYEWDMGNGDVIAGKECDYFYSTCGSYDITLTVTDKSGNVTRRTSNIVVGKDVGVINVTVKDGNTVLPDADVVLCINGSARHSGERMQTDKNGKQKFSVSEGTYQIAAYKAGYAPVEKTVEVTKGETTEVVITLKKAEFIEAEVSARKMTKEEMKAAGIDMDAEDNRVALTYTCTLDFGQDQTPKFTFPSNGKGLKLSGSLLNIYCAGSPDDDKDKIKPESVYITDNTVDEDHSTVMVTQVAQSEIGWLNDIYIVQVTVYNMSAGNFAIEDSTLELKLPTELGLAQMKKNKSNKETAKLGTIKGGESATATWYVCGSVPGEYKIGAELNGTLQPFDKQIQMQFETDKDICITVGDGLHLYIYLEDEAYINENYYIQYKLKNESEETYHYVTTDFGSFETANAVAQVVVVEKDKDGNQVSVNTLTADTGVEYFMNVPKDTGYVLTANNRLTAKTLAPGKAIYGTYKFQFKAGGDAYENYYKLKDYFANADKNSNVKVTVSAITGHLKRELLKKEVREEPENTSNNQTGTGTNTTGSNPGGTPGTPDSTQTTKDPINLMTGAFTVDHTVAAVAGAAKLSFDVSYNSLLTDETGELGRGWYHNYEMSLERVGSMITLHMNPYEKMYFAESDETADTVCGRIENGEVLLDETSDIERTYYQTGTDSRKYRIVKDDTGCYTLYIQQEKYQFDAEGNLTGYITEQGSRVAVSRTKQALTITDCATDKSITASYDKNGRITKVEDAAGNVTGFAYKGDCMTKLTGKTGAVLSYEYDENGHITKGLENETHVYVENTYDDKGRVLSQVANGTADEKTVFQYTDNEKDGTTSVVMTNADGTKEKALTDRYGQGLRYENAIGGVTKYLYNDKHDMTGYRMADGSGADYTYDANGDLTVVTETTGKKTTYTYDGEHRVTGMTCNDGTDVKYTYNEAGQRTAVSGANGLKAEYTYNQDGQVLTEKSELGTIQYTYKDGLLYSVTDYAGNTQTLSYDANGNVIQYTDANGVVTSYALDASGRVLSESIHVAEGKKATTSYTYDVYGKVLSKTDAGGNTTKYAYDEHDRLSAETRPDGSKITYQYDTNGNITQIAYPDGKTAASAVYDAAGNTLELVDTLRSVSKGSYSVGGQLLALTQPNGGVVKYTYYDNGLLKSQTDAEGNMQKIAYDGAGRVTSVTDAAGNSTKYRYDKYGNLAIVEDSLGNAVRMEYNAFRKIVKQTDARGNATQYAYDRNLNCNRITDAEGNVTELAYDGTGNLTKMIRKGKTEAEDMVLSLAYDPLGNLTAVTDGEGNTQNMEYNLNSQLTAVYDAYGTKTAAYAYDALGNVAAVTDADGNRTENTYDAFGNLIRQWNRSADTAVEYTYLGGKYLSGSKDALGNTASMTYDNMGNVESITNPNGGVTSYRYDLNNNLTDETIGEDYHIHYAYNAQNLPSA